MSKYFILILILILEIITSAPLCIVGTNYCSKCHPVTKLCIKCEKDIYIPDDYGGCKNAHICIKGNNHCLECTEEAKLCKKCEESYFPDENGGCSYTDNCEISYEGDCIKCKGDFILIGKTENNTLVNEIKICKSLTSEDLKNCEEINIENGKCLQCKNGYYLSNDNNKCTSTQNCDESTFGVCSRCSPGFYLDKKHQNCLMQEGVFQHCRESLNGKSCDICEDFYFFDGEGICCGTNYCEKRGEFYRCEKCIDGYYFTISRDSCTKEKNCYFGNKDFGTCHICDDDYYIDFKDGKCKSNLEDNDLKYCEAAEGKCKECIYGYYLDMNNKCCLSKHCSESYLGTCIVCQDNYYLGKDNRCIDVQHFIYSNEKEECLECENNYYYNRGGNNCKIAEGKFKNCKIGNENGNCEKCKDDYYLNRKDNLCYSNSGSGPFYKCAISDSNGEKCNQCIDNYYLGYLDDKCSTIEGCDMSENENKCLVCNEYYYCLNLKDHKCYSNGEITDEKTKFYYNCNNTNEEGTMCANCLEGYELNEQGLCIDEESCLIKEGGVCKKCREDWIYLCLNDFFGCIHSYSDHCSECSQLLGFSKCTKCKDGYVLNEYNNICEEPYNS